MRVRLALAFSIALLFVGLASWYRLANTNEVPANILAVETSSDNPNYGDILPEFTGLETASTTPRETKPLSNAGLLGRGLILDYVDLVASGQADDKSLLALADRYAESVPTFSVAPTISYRNLQGVSDTETNLRSYASSLELIHQEYAESVRRSALDNSNPVNLGPSMSALLSDFSLAYEVAASRLKNIPVPLSLVPLHLELVNSYLSSATAMRAITKSDEDPALAFAGLANLNVNLNKESLILGEIARNLNADGI